MSRHKAINNFEPERWEDLNPEKGIRQQELLCGSWWGCTHWLGQFEQSPAFSLGYQLRRIGSGFWRFAITKELSIVWLKSHTKHQPLWKTKRGKLGSERAIFCDSRNILHQWFPNFSLDVGNHICRGGALPIPDPPAQINKCRSELWLLRLTPRQGDKCPQRDLQQPKISCWCSLHQHHCIAQ